MHTRVSVFRSVPSFFRKCCATASAGRQPSYADAGYHLTLHIAALEPYEAEEGQWVSEVRELWNLASSQNEAEVLRWFLARFPACMGMVPKRRRQNFVAGIYQALNRSDL